MRLAALTALAAIAIWVGAGSLHEHPGDPGCQVCKLLQNGAADVANPTTLPAAHGVGLALVADADAPAIAVVPCTPPGRAPPLA